MLHLLTTLSLAGAAAASYAANLNYRSPSWNHPGLGISIHKVNKRNAGAPPYTAARLNFTHGVASGDPYPQSVVLWTRCAPIADNVKDNTTVSGYVPLYNPVPIYDDENAISTAPICVSFKIATDRGLTQVVDSGTAYTSSDVDYTLKVGKIPSYHVSPVPFVVFLAPLDCKLPHARKVEHFSGFDHDTLLLSDMIIQARSSTPWRFIDFVWIAEDPTVHGKIAYPSIQQGQEAGARILPVPEISQNADVSETLPFFPIVATFAWLLSSSNFYIRQFAFLAMALYWPTSQSALRSYFVIGERNGAGSSLQTLKRSDENRFSLRHL